MQKPQATCRRAGGGQAAGRRRAGGGHQDGESHRGWIFHGHHVGVIWPLGHGHLPPFPQNVLGSHLAVSAWAPIRRHRDNRSGAAGARFRRLHEPDTQRGVTGGSAACETHSVNSDDSWFREQQASSLWKVDRARQFVCTHIKYGRTRKHVCTWPYHFHNLYGPHDQCARSIQSDRKMAGLRAQNYATTECWSAGPELAV